MTHALRRERPAGAVPLLAAPGVAVPSLAWSPGLILAALGLFALMLRLACLTGLIGSDDLGYAKYARALMEGTYGDAVEAVERRHHALRYAVLLPVAAAYRLFGISEWTTILVPLLASTLSVVLLAEIGRQMFSLRVGVIAGLLYATFPIQLIMGTILVPEPIAACYVLLGVLCYLHARERGGWRWVAAGVLMGSAYLAKEPALFVGGAFLLHALWERRWRGAILLALGVAAVGAAEHAYYFFGRGDLMFRPNSTRLYTLPPAEEFFTPVQRHLGYRLLRKYPQMMLVPHLKFGLHSLACLLGAAAALALRPRRWYLMLMLWAVIPWLYLNFGSWSFERYAPLPADPRYIEFTYPPLMLLTAVALSRALAGSAMMARSAVAMLAVVMVSGAASGFLMRGTTAHAPAMTVLRQIVTATLAEPGRTIYTENDKWRRALEIFDPRVLSASPAAATFVLGTDALGHPALEPSTPAAGGEER